MQGLYVGGSSGEAMFKGMQERIEFLDLVARIDGGGMPLTAQVGAIATADTVALAERTAAAGYQAVSAIAARTTASPAAR